MVGLDFMLQKEKAVNFVYDEFLREKRKIKDLTLTDDEVILNEVLELEEENMEIIKYVLEKYTKAAKKINIYTTIALGAIEKKKEIITTKFLKKDNFNDYIIETDIEFDDFLAHFSTLAQFEYLEKLIRKSPMLRYVNMIISIIKQLPILQQNYKIETYIVYGEKDYFGENEDHVAIGFTITKI